MKSHRLLLCTLALFLASGTAVHADHPVAPVPDDQFVDFPWREHHDWDASNSGIDVGWFFDLLVPLPNDAWRDRVKDGKDIWAGHYGVPAEGGIHNVRLNQMGSRFVTPRNNNRVGCPAEVSNDTFPKSFWIAVGYDVVRDIESGLPIMSWSAATSKCQTWNFWGNESNREIYYQINAAHGNAAFWSSTNAPPNDKLDLFSMSVHEFGHALGWWKGQDSQGHFTEPIVCNPAQPESFQSMCPGITTGSPNAGAVQLNTRTLNSHDRSASKDGYFPNCNDDVPPCDL